MTRHELTAPAAARGERIDRWLAAALPDLSRARVARLIAEGRVHVDAREARPSTRLRGGEAVSCDVPEPASGDLVPEEVSLVVLAEDDDLVILDKPAGLVVHPGAGVREGTLVHALLHHCGSSLLGVGGAGRPGIVHRLDKGTSGAIVVAKTPAAYLSLAAQFAARTVEKTYLAVVRGAPPPAGRVDAAIARSPVRRTRMAVRAAGRRALSDWRVLEQFGRSAALVEIGLHTGRTHQARVHMAHAGHPIVGDEAYGAGGTAPDPAARPALAAFRRPALHAWRLAFDHPRTGLRVVVEAPMPEDIATLVTRLRQACPVTPPAR